MRLTVLCLAALLVGCAQSAPPKAAQSQYTSGKQASSRPDYPIEYDKSGRTGVVVISCLVPTSGILTDYHLVSVTGGDAFGKAVMDWFASGTVRFSPALRNGVPVAERSNLTINFAQ
jgi:TonB family protein